MSSEAKKPKKAKNGQKKEPQSDRIFPEISIEKETVIVLVTEGGLSIKEAAIKIRKTPMSVYQWFRDDDAFLSCLAKQKQYIHEQIRAEYSGLPKLAYGVIRDNLISKEVDEHGKPIADPRLALSYLKDSGNLVRTVDKENADDKAKRAAQALLSELESIADASE